VSTHLLIGFGKVEITPPPGIPYLSYYPRQTPFEGIHDRLYARAVVAEGPAEGRPGGTAVAIVSADALGFSRAILGPGRDFIAEARARIAARTGIPAAHVLIAATHAHSTPQTTDLAPLVELFPQAAGWLERLIDRLAAAVAMAWACREPAELRGATGLAPGIAWSRRIVTVDGRLTRLRDRPPDAQVAREARDDRVPLLLAVGQTRRGAVLGFTCHPVTVQVQPLVSADYPGVACALVEAELGLDACVFLQGACGDINPVRDTTDFDDVAIYGRSLGGEALRLLALLGAPGVAQMRPVVAAGSEVVELARRALPARGPLEQQAAELAQRIAHVGSEAERQEAITAYRRVAEPLRLVELGTGPVRVEVQVLRIGDALIVSCEGELFVEFGRRLTAASPAAVTFVAGYSNGYEGYLPTPETFDEGGYEASLGPWTRVGPAGGEAFTARATALMERVWRQGEG
jgi:hypothetical protein